MVNAKRPAFQAALLYGTWTISVCLGWIKIILHMYIYIYIYCNWASEIGIADTASPLELNLGF
jgi:hypothetical protein